MSAVGTKLFRDEDGRMLFECPGCGFLHGVFVDRAGRPKWGWNGDGDRPTFTPSILVTSTRPLSEEARAKYRAGEPVPRSEPTVCHSIVTDGRVQFLGDCTHALAGQTVDLPDWED